MIRALIVEDAPLVRQGIRLFLQSERDIEVVGEAVDGPDAVAQIGAHRPDLVFLDIQMPGFDGFEVLSRCQEANLRAVIFITAHADYALRAFDNNAVSYLLKPIEQPRFREVVERARRLLREPSQLGPQERRPPTGATGMALPAQEAALSAQLDANKHLVRVLVKHGERFLVIKTAEIDWITATGEYACLHTKRGKWLLRMSLSELAERLDENRFARIHRCTIVNLDRVIELQSLSHGDCEVILDDGSALRLSRNYRDGVFPKLG